MYFLSETQVFWNSLGKKMMFWFEAVHLAACLGAVDVRSSCLVFQAFCPPGELPGAKQASQGEEWKKVSHRNVIWHVNLEMSL